MTLYDTLVERPCPPGYRLGWVNLPALLERVHSIEQEDTPLVDEQVLTYLIGYGYCVHHDGPARLVRAIFGNEMGDFT